MAQVSFCEPENSCIFDKFWGCRHSIFIFEMVIRFVCPLAFQCHIPNYYTAKTCEDMKKRKRKVENNLKYGIGKLMDRRM